MMVEPNVQLPRYEDPPALPPDEFDPLNNSDDVEQLAEFWLPDRPNKVTEPELFEHWAEMMRPPLRFVLARDEERRLFRSSLPFSPLSGDASVSESRNWSGAVTMPNTGGRFTRVVGRWVVPRLNAGADPNPEGLMEGSTMWIGLDGSFPWSQAMPQVGSAHYIDKQGQVQYHLWFQWWLRDFNSSEHQILGVPISADDEIYANISVLSPYAVLVHVANRNTKTFTTKKLWYVEPSASSIPILGASAEWILERPANAALATPSAPNGPLYPLPDYGTVPVTRCATRMDNLRPPGWSPRLLRLAEVMPVAPHMILESVPIKRGQPVRSFRLEYKRPT